ncbi:MAG: PSD1 domain-containing protein [Verrucomicrobiaceae bacterium]|nr:PSD1 domain-containing protein [Verrucomicrobiaceae bacterium]
MAVDYAKDIKPLLKERCYACHGALKQKAGLRLDTVALMKTGGDNGDATKHLLDRLTTTDKSDRMPPEGEGAMFNAEQVAKVREWIAAGAPGLTDEQPEADPRAHWAYQVPKNTNKSIDALHAAHLAAKQLKPQPAASHDVWLRRVYFDLTGLPTSDSSDMSDLSDAQLIDRLLASPHFGERWARHFMDIWRYCDWYGLGAQLRHSQKHIWHWRDWIIESLNADKGYDRMIIEQLAADELAPEDRSTLRATGFLARSYYLFNRTTWLDETLEHTSRAFLGLTMQCVKCHDHKYDPVDQADYYRLRAVFEPLHVRLDPLPGITDLEKNGLPRVFDLHLDRSTFRHIRGDEKNEDKSKPMTPGIPGVLEFASFTPKSIKLPKTISQPFLQPFVLKDHLAAAEAEIANLEKQLPSKPKASAAITNPQTILRDDFAKPRPEAWKTVSGTWKHENGSLRQSETGMTRRLMQLTKTPPADFDAKVSFTIRGGQKWKSVGLVFDLAEHSDVLVYVSAVQGGSKVQIAPGENGQASYPAGGSHAMVVKENERHMLQVRALGQLVQVSVDGKQVITYTLTKPRVPGAMALAAFDADVAFHSFELATLPADALLASNTPRIEKQLVAAKLKPVMLRAAFAAESKKGGQALAKAAALAEAQFKLAKAEADLAALDAKADAKKLKAAKDAVAAAQKKLKAPGETYTPLLASLKAQEGPDDPDNTKVQTYPDTSTGRRLAFAQWIADKRNPLTARVLVNQVWMRLTGSSFVPDVSDFGLRAPAPAQQDILDTLAAGFMENGWSLKWLIKQIVLSDLYRRSSSNAGADAHTLAADPDNTLLWRMNPRRLESQSVRDALLALGGKLDLTLGGPSLDPDKAESTPRRSLYFVQTPDTEHRFLGAFDNANVLECYRRNESVVPQQALALTNSQLSRATADALASKLAHEAPADFIQRAFQAILNRAPTDKENQVSLEALTAMKSNRPLFLQALLNHNDFVTLR